jgi:NAD-dependent SIR2 family protein deacetylase
MATTIDSFVVTCLKCGEEYTTWTGIDLEEIEPDPCPQCGFAPSDDPWFYEDGLIEPIDEDEARLSG